MQCSQESTWRKYRHAEFVSPKPKRSRTKTTTLKYDEARILLSTLIYTYSDSPLIPQAKLLIFDSDGHDEKRRNEEARELLRQIDEYFDRTHPKPRDQ